MVPASLKPFFEGACRGALCSDTPGPSARPAVRCRTGLAAATRMACDLEVYARVLIAPTRGRNREARAATRPPPTRCPHRPYEGSQHDERVAGKTRRRSSSPLRGVATAVTHPRLTSIHEGPHRPYEGSQQRIRVYEEHERESSSPLRGVATLLRLQEVGRLRVLIAPTRGRNSFGFRDSA
mgnify:CR=1 FL=1